MDGITNFVIACTGLVVALTTLGSGIYAVLKLLKGQQTIHTLVNSSFGNQLLLTAKALRVTADRTKDKNDIDTANAAEKLYTDHQAKQNSVDKT